MFIEQVEFENLSNPPPQFQRWKMRVVLHGDGFDDRAAPIQVTVGEQNVEMIVPMVLENSIGGIQGFLVEVPQDGDVVSVGYADGPLFPTDFQFSNDLVVA
ncbi:hypothetical protein [Pistricoccus aurantiacus]|uniref:Uncharacterized protein n=1 Tax=Pistricoccus aurantiacus TaxID=1883414 RepID=A0A5B8SRD3_9GAMM|nr:hypothetical protein [Pistricoccus aurantiacus]QEA39672.1 hypothetical protein FGL86_11725 [Pistricoccus aurantiacus]